MRLTRVFVDGPLAPGSAVALPDGAVGHLTRVLRLAEGDAVRVFDGRGGEYDATLAAVTKKGASLRVGEHHAIDVESPLAVTLLQGISRGDRMDFIVQKATELGVTRLRALRALRSSVKVDAAATERKLAHWRGIAISACEQCGRNTVPELLEPQTVAEAVAAADAGGLRLVLALDGAVPLAQRLRDAGGRVAAGITLLVGPEGGLDDGEAAAARAAGFLPCVLGPRVLRTETAPLAALAALQSLAGDFCGG